jgi:hypothetical protein
VADRVYKPSDVEFALAIVQSVPDIDKSVLKTPGETLYQAKIFKNVLKKK